MNLVRVIRPRIVSMVHRAECPAARKAAESGRAYPIAEEFADRKMAACARCLKDHSDSLGIFRTEVSK